MKTADRIAIALLLSAGACLSQAPPAGQAPVRTIPDEEAADAYAVYSAVFRNQETVRQDQNKTYLIAGTTGELYRGGPGLSQCVRVDPSIRSDFDEIVAAYAEHGQDRYRIDFRLDAGKFYVLLNEAETREIGERIESLRKQHGSTHLIQLSNAFFNQRRTLALVIVSAYCGPLCGKKTMDFYRKDRDGSWTPVTPHPLCPLTVS